ncbi:hypothetical protein [Paraburkholderia sp. DHOC27]|uniref:hypothetical protein n=1 Tax=Paraburkholderia sp. DHOC27 TaxID=2303330 RepID=UPI000E3E4AFC|nr:hypothetical protein [Paraburkholderia sp. DHOC27]RFU44817.1 hypothetical protein D0B32_27420 [Paraburkholderia sp. DHOC27]
MTTLTFSASGTATMDKWLAAHPGATGAPSVPVSGSSDDDSAAQAASLPTSFKSMLATRVNDTQDARSKQALLDAEARLHAQQQAANAGATQSSAGGSDAATGAGANANAGVPAPGSVIDVHA